MTVMIVVDSNFSSPYSAELLLHLHRNGYVGMDHRTTESSIHHR